MEEKDMEDTGKCTSESHDANKVKAIFKKGLPGSNSRSVSNASDKISTFMQFFREATKMTLDFKITLPSDKSWRMKNYFKLLYKQKEKKIILHSMPSQESDVSSNWDPVLLAQPELKRAKFSGSLSVSSEGSLPTCYSLDISWNALDIAKAGTILKSNSSSEISFLDEEEMRRVFTLLYDVFRYKHILNEALLETRFFQKYPEHNKVPSLVWLLFYDLHKRRFLPREHTETVLCAESFSEIGLKSIERDLWKSKVKLAASLARNRIKNNALRLNQLLPNHLRDERLVSPEESPITGWINTFRMSKREVCDKIEKFGLKLQSKHETVLTKNDFRFDHLCPKLLLCHPVQRGELAQSNLVKDHTVVLQDRAFCIGPAIIAKILSEVPLRGTVAQSHVNSPRTTAYLANILADNDRLDKMVAFGAGDKLLEYQTYLHNLGVSNCEIYAQKFTDIHPEAAVLENLVAIFATPPNSCTGVTDPVDLICSRGGDMYMLKSLTRTDMTGSSSNFLEEQRETLEYSMSLPQVQIVLYETHSMSPEENLDMVTKMINKMNDFAKEKHEEDRRITLEQEAAEQKSNKPIGIPGMLREKEKEPQEVRESPADKEVVVPPCDLFEIAPLPVLCSHGSECLAEEGCYLARIQRKEIISLDAKYMIKIAEARGLFGNELAQKKSSTVRASKKREELTPQRSGSGKMKSRKVKVEIERITAPTLSSIHRTKKGDSSMAGFADCPRHHFHTLESANKVEVLSARSGSGIMRRKSRTKKCQDETMRRLAKPNRRWSASPSDFLSEVRPSFWRFATAKSVEDLIRTLRRKRKVKRSSGAGEARGFRNGNRKPGSGNGLTDSEVIPGLQINFFGKKYLYPFRAPFLYNKRMNQSPVVSDDDDSYLQDIILVIDENDPKIVKKSSVNASLGESESPRTAAATAGGIVSETDSEFLRRCFQDANQVFTKVEEAIDKEKETIKMPESSRASIVAGNEPAKALPKKGYKKFYRYLQKITDMDEINNIKPTRANGKRDIVLHEKYLPGKQNNPEDKKFMKLLKNKLEKLQAEFPAAGWTRRKEQMSAARLSKNRQAKNKNIPVT